MRTGTDKVMAVVYHGPPINAITLRNVICRRDKAAQNSTREWHKYGSKEGPQAYPFSSPRSPAMQSNYALQRSR